LLFQISTSDITLLLLTTAICENNDKTTKEQYNIVSYVI